jgi:hypothetical protein
MPRHSSLHVYAVVLFASFGLASWAARPALGQASPAVQNTAAGSQQQISKPEASQPTIGDQAQNPGKTQETKRSDDKGKGDDKAKDTAYTREAFLGAMAVFAVLAFLFWLQLKWSNRLEQAGYLGQLFRDNLEEIEFKRLSADTAKRYNERQFYTDVRADVSWLSTNPRPEGYSQTYFENQRPGGTQNPFRPPPGLPLRDENLPISGLIPPPQHNDDAEPESRPAPASRTASEEQRQKRQNELQCKAEEDRKAAERWQKNRDWDNSVDCEVTRRYNAALADARERARNLAEKGINIELAALRGRGPEFVLGFTTIVAIVFAAAALGILGRLDSQQIGTLFAAIAGYVLGRATSRAATPASEQPQSASPNVTVNVPRQEVAALASESKNGTGKNGTGKEAKKKDGKVAEQEEERVLVP